MPCCPVWGELDAVLSRAVTLERLKAVARRHSQVI